MAVGLMKATATLARPAVVHYRTTGEFPTATVWVGGTVGAVRFGARALDRAVAYARREGLHIHKVEVFDREDIVTNEDAERRARQVWGVGPVLVTRVADAHSRAGDDWAEWMIDVAGDHRTHALDGEGRVTCKHADCRRAGGEGAER